MAKCVCGSNKEYNDCCKQFISKKAIPSSAEILMRSRYTAYTLGEIDYIMETHDPETISTVSKDVLSNWSSSSKWIKLTILDSHDLDENQAIVEFEAIYEVDTLKHIHHEKSLFIKKEDRWFYSDSLPINQTIKKDIKIKRNDPCSCGSGKKYKKCCGN